MNDATVAGPGVLVRAGRESRKLSQQDIADTLNLTLRVVADLELENWSRLPPAAFTRGYLRAYAKLLEIDPDQVARAFDATVGRGATHVDPVATPLTQRRRGGVAELLQKHPGAVLTGAVAAVICAVLVVLWAVWPDAPERTIAARPAVAAPSSIVAAPTPPTADVVAAPVKSETETPTPPASKPIALEAAARADAVSEPDGAQRISSSGEDRLTFAFTDDCWVEIKDGQGARLYGDLGSAGTSLELIGQAPFRILLGNAPGATLQFNGERVALAPHTRNNVGTLVLGQ